MYVFKNQDWFSDCPAVNWDTPFDVFKRNNKDYPVTKTFIFITVIIPLLILFFPIYVFFPKTYIYIKNSLVEW